MTKHHCFCPRCKCLVDNISEFYGVVSFHCECGAEFHLDIQWTFPAIETRPRSVVEVLEVAGVGIIPEVLVGR